MKWGLEEEENEGKTVKNIEKRKKTNKNKEIEIKKEKR